MTESKKTTTVSFRIEDDLKEKLLSIAEQGFHAQTAENSVWPLNRLFEA